MHPDGICPADILMLDDITIKSVVLFHLLAKEYGCPIVAIFKPRTFIFKLPGTERAPYYKRTSGFLVQTLLFY